MSNAVFTDWPSGSANTGWPQEPSAMLMPGRVQGWPAGTQRAANAAERLLSQAVAWWDVEQYRDGDRFLRNRGTGGELLDLRLGSSIAPNSNDPRYLAPENQGYVYLPGVASNYLSVPDEAALDITGDIDIRVRVALDDWTPATSPVLVDRWGYSGAYANNRSWQLSIDTAGNPVLITSSSGTALTKSFTSSVATGVTDGAVKWVRATLDVDNGASGATAKFWLSDDGVSWTQLGTDQTSAGATSLFAPAVPLNIGSDVLGTSNMLTGKVYRAQVLNGIDGTTVLDIDCDAITSGSATSFTAVTNQTVTINRSTSGRKSVAMPSRHKGGKPVMLLGTDDYLEVQDSWQHGLLNFGQGDSFTVLVGVRAWANAWDDGNGDSIISKRDNLFSWDLGYSAGTIGNQQFLIGDGTNFVTPQATSSQGVLQILTGIVGPSNAQVYVNTTAGTAISRLSVRNITSTAPCRIGRRGSGLAYADMEFYGAAVFRRALSAAEIKTLSDYFTGRIA